MKKQLAIMTPTREGLVDINYTSSLVESVKMIEDWDIRPTILSGVSDIIGGRNTLFNAWYYNTNTDALMFIDSDISWHPQDLKKWLDRPEVGVIAANYPKKKFKPLSFLQCAQVFQSATGSVDPEKVLRSSYDYVSTGAHNEITGGEFKGLHTVDGVGMGFFLIYREAADILMDWAEKSLTKCKFENNEDGFEGEGYNVFDPFIDENGTNWREDFAFCRRLKNAGLTIFLDSRVPLRHTGYTNFDGEFFAQLQMVKLVKDNPELTLPNKDISIKSK